MRLIVGDSDAVYRQKYNFLLLYFNLIFTENGVRGTDPSGTTEVPTEAVNRVWSGQNSHGAVGLSAPCGTHNANT